MPKPDDPDILARFAEATRKGHPLATASTMAGLEASTGSHWRAVGEQQLEAGDEHGSHVLFVQTLRAAEAVFVDTRLDRIDAAGAKGNWAADMTVLERRRPQDFGRNQTVNVKQESLTVVLQGTLPPGAEHELIAQAAARLRAAQLQIEAGGASQDDSPPPPDITLSEA